MKSIFHFENIRFAFRYIRTNGLRTILTTLVIIFGIMSLVTMVTALDGLKNSILENFSQMGSNTFTIYDKSYYNSHNGRQKSIPKISYNEAKIFKSKYDFPALVSVNYTALGNAIVKYRSEKTNPKISVIGTDEHYFAVSNLEIEKGRNFNNIETQYGANVCIIGVKLKESLFKDIDPLGKIITVGANKLKVVGILKERGSTFGFSHDNIVVMPLTAARKSIPSSNEAFTIMVKVNDIGALDVASEEAIAIMRMTRKLKPGEENNFELEKSDSLISIIAKDIRVMTIITLVVSIVTLISSAVSLMNIMLVSVKERITEIGTLKAIGARVSNIKSQFLSEAVAISQLGGLIGITTGIFLGNIVASKLGSHFVVPWGWILIAYLLSLIVGAAAGYYPAVKAARLNPIDALRYE